MMRRLPVSITVSLTLHMLVFIIFAGIKLYKNEDIGDNVAVTFVSEREKPTLRRLNPVRPMVSFDNSPRHNDPEQQYIRPDYRAPVESYYSPPERVFSEIRSVDREVFQGVWIQPPSIQLQRDLAVPLATDLLNKPHTRGIKIQPHISEGRDFLGKIDLPKPELNITYADDALQEFLLTVRRKIESKKKYPVAAQEAEIQGHTSIKMTILKDGRLANVKVTDSSGYEILDRAALQSVRDAAPFPAFPKSVKRDRIDMSIRLIFTLTRG